MEKLADQYEVAVTELKALARQLRIRNPAKLLQAARGRVAGASLRLAQLALEDSASKQVLAPAYRSTGKSAAEGPNERLQADLIDMSQNTRTKERFALMISDVYTREVRAKTLTNKRPETVSAAMKDLLPTLVEDTTSFVIATDAGREFSRLEEGGIPAQAVHRSKKGTNDIAVLDRAMQSVKQDSAAAIADGDAKNWVDALPLAISAHNARPHSAVFGAPENVESVPAQDFRVLQANARKGLLNRNSQLSKSNTLKEAGAFRAPLPSKRSFEPRYGDVQLLGGVRSGDGDDVVRNRGEGTFLLKQIQPVIPGSAKSAGRLTEKGIPRKIRLQERAAEVEEHLREAGGTMEVTILERQIRRGLLGLLKVFRRNNITIRGFLRLYPERFINRRGIVSVKEIVDVPMEVPAPVEVPAELPLKEQIRIADERQATRAAARAQTAKDRLRGLSTYNKRSGV